MRWIKRLAEILAIAIMTVLFGPGLGLRDPRR
jgi:hypothetical protein